jgi:hypothetical protein
MIRMTLIVEPQAAIDGSSGCPTLPIQHYPTAPRSGLRQNVHDQDDAIDGWVSKIRRRKRSRQRPQRESQPPTRPPRRAACRLAACARSNSSAHRSWFRCADAHQSLIEVAIPPTCSFSAPSLLDPASLTNTHARLSCATSASDHRSRRFSSATANANSSVVHSSKYLNTFVTCRMQRLRAASSNEIALSSR